MGDLEQIGSASAGHERTEATPTPEGDQPYLVDVVPEVGEGLTVLMLNVAKKIVDRIARHRDG